MRGAMRALAACAALFGGLTGWASAAKALPCAEYVSTRIDDAPGVGHLVGTETITYTLSVSPGGVGGTMSTTFEVGNYDFGHDVQMRLDCRTYKPFV